MVEKDRPHPRVAVCLAACNGMTWIGPQVDSILAQENVEIRIIASVDHSTDATEGWLRDLAARDPRVTLLPTAPTSGGAAQNFFRLLREGDFNGCDYIALSDQDDIWLPDKLARAIQRLNGSKAQGYSSDALAFWPNGRRKLIRKSQPQKIWDYFFESPGPGCTFVLDPRLMASLRAHLATCPQALTNISFHDWFVYAFARARGYSWVIDNRPYLLYRQHASNVFGVNRGWLAFQRRTLMSVQGWHLKQARLIAHAVGAAHQEFVQRTLFAGPWGYFRLPCLAGQCRRKRWDQILLALSSLSLGAKELFSHDRNA